MQKMNFLKNISKNKLRNFLIYDFKDYDYVKEYDYIKDYVSKTVIKHVKKLPKML